MKVGLLDWSNGEGTVLFTKEFRMASWTEQMDAMVDWMAQLQKEYNSRLAEYVGRGGRAGLPSPDDAAPTD